MPILHDETKNKDLWKWSKSKLHNMIKLHFTEGITILPSSTDVHTTLLIHHALLQ